ncbi:MAG: SMEK domain-containing protein [Anaerolineae bacterium]|nr:SMEK domain-containing protein [Anaerolineae bacterium]
MRSERAQARIRELMSIFVTEMKGASSQNDTYVNQLAENVLVPLFKIAHGWNALRNLNEIERRNFPAIDLADDDARVAIQVTATPDSRKVKETLETFINHKLYDKYDRLIIYILTEKQRTYSGSGFAEILDGRFSFDKDDDIWDYRDFLNTTNGLAFESAWRIEHILEQHFSDNQGAFFHHEQATQTEEVFLNLLELTLPNELFVAQTAVDREGVIKESKHRRIRLNQWSAARDIIRAALEQEGLGFGTDWVCHEGKIITFHALNNPDLPLHKVIDSGTVETFAPDSFYGIDEDYERVFKDLLRRTLQQSLYHLGVQWQNEDKLYIFVDLGGELLRRETWPGSKDGRMVYRRIMKDNKPDEALRHEHFGFRTQFKRFGEQWYLVITPEWFASYDGYQKDKFGNFVEWKKRNENNTHVATHARFIAHFLKDKLNKHPLPLFDDDAFEEDVPGNPSFLSFGEFVSFSEAPALDDNAYLPNKKASSKQEPEADTDQPIQMTLLEP